MLWNLAQFPHSTQKPPLRLNTGTTPPPRLPWDRGNGMKVSVMSLNPLRQFPTSPLPVPDLISLSDSEEAHSHEPNVGRTKSDPLHLQAARTLTHMLAHTPSEPLPMPVPLLDTHLPSTIYYGGHKIHYSMYKSIPQLVMTDSQGMVIGLPVDQDLVLVFYEAEHLAFSISYPASSLHQLFRPFLFTASRTRPRTRLAPTPSTDNLRNLLSTEQIRQATSLVPMDNSKDTWVESNQTVLTKLTDLMSSVLKSDTHYLPISHMKVVSSNTGVSQYLQAPILSWNPLSLPTSDIKSLFKPRAPQDWCKQEADARQAANIYWALLQPFLVTADLEDVIHHTVVATKVEGKQPLSALVGGSQEALWLGIGHMMNMFLWVTLKAFKLKLSSIVLGRLSRLRY